MLEVRRVGSHGCLRNGAHTPSAFDSPGRSRREFLTAADSNWDEVRPRAGGLRTEVGMAGAVGAVAAGVKCETTTGRAARD